MEDGTRGQTRRTWTASTRAWWSTRRPERGTSFGIHNKKDQERVPAPSTRRMKDTVAAKAPAPRASSWKVVDIALDGMPPLWPPSRLEEEWAPEPAMTGQLCERPFRSEARIGSVTLAARLEVCHKKKEQREQMKGVAVGDGTRGQARRHYTASRRAWRRTRRPKRGTSSGKKTSAGCHVATKVWGARPTSFRRRSRLATPGFVRRCVAPLRQRRCLTPSGTGSWPLLKMDEEAPRRAALPGPLSSGKLRSE